MSEENIIEESLESKMENDNNELDEKSKQSCDEYNFEDKSEEDIDYEKLYNEEKSKYDELYDKYLRALSEYDNYRKRTQKEKESLFEIALSDTVSKFIPVLDNLYRASDAYKDNETIQSGLLMIARQFEEILSSLKVEKIKTVGEEFDPNLHNAALHVEDNTVGANIIVEELTTGYKIGDRVIRHSIVKVAN